MPWLKLPAWKVFEIAGSNPTLAFKFQNVSFALTRNDLALRQSQRAI